MKFLAKVQTLRRISIPKRIFEALKLKIGDLVEVEVKPYKG